MHQPVMLTEVLDYLQLKPGQTVIDATVGGGGHTQAILKQIQPNGRLLGLDRDATTLAEVNARLTTDPSLANVSITLVADSFDHLEEVAATNHLTAVDGILFDLGFSSLQLDDPTRGFSFQNDGPLDMRLNPDDQTTAASLINRSTERQLADIFYQYGELYDARRMAKTLVEARQRQPIERTLQLVTILGLKNPGVKAKVFQALRIAVNAELAQLEAVIPQAVSLLKPGGRIAMLTFHSLEDRIVKQQFKSNHHLQLVTKKPLVPTEQEIATNPRSRSAKLRVAEKTS